MHRTSLAMNVETVKSELISWIEKLSDKHIIKRLLSVKKEVTSEPKPSQTAYGSGKHLVAHIADDFNEPLDLFGDYVK